MSNDTQDIKEKAEAAGEAASETAITEAKRASRGIRQFAKAHPAASLLAAAGASALVGGEFALGALIGVGAAMLVTNKSGAEVRRDLQTMGRKLVGSGKTWSQRFLGAAHRAKSQVETATTAEPTTPPKSAQP